MNILPIPEEEQIRALLDGAIYDLLRNYVVHPERVDFRKFITLNRQKLIDFLSVHTDEAENYFRKHSATTATHDAEKIWRDGSEYVTAWLDHGQLRSTRRFATLGEAVAEHILVSHGMY
ncbi:MAG: hypothetical protein IPL29_16045 [Propionivibrio sp.]|nr:hypothetical protein [Propionivibrio sp.]